MSARAILLVDDDPGFRRDVRDSLGGAYRVTEAATEGEFREHYRPYAFDLVILDMRLRAGQEGLELLREIYAHDELQPVIVVSAYGDTATTLDAVESGALMFLDKKEFTPNLIARMVLAVLQQGAMRRRLAVLEEQARLDPSHELVGNSPGILEACRRLREGAEREERVVITGEPGSGRTRAARAVHRQNRRRSHAAFVPVTPAELREEAGTQALFGTRPRPGAPRRRGALEQAHRGVLFLQELTAFPETLVSEIVRIVDERRLLLPDTGATVPLDAQLVASCNLADRKADSAAPRLFSKASPRSRQIEVFLPPLRERREDIPLLVACHLQSFGRQGWQAPSTISREVLKCFETYLWPANIRELANVLEFSSIRAVAAGADVIELEHLPARLGKVDGGSESGALAWDYRYHIARAELELTALAMGQHGLKNKASLAAFLGYNDRLTFYRRIQRSLESFPSLTAEFPNVARQWQKRHTA